MRLPMLSRVTSRKIRAPLASSVKCTAASCVWESNPGLGIGQIFAGENDLLLDDDGLAIALQKADSIIAMSPIV